MSSLRVVETTVSRRAPIDRVMDLVGQQHRRRGACAQICAIHHDQVVLDRVWGCSPDALFYIYSASKPFVALLVHLQ
jgi:CubicO group peptidase (beta-lactamase class C family)